MKYLTECDQKKLFKSPGETKGKKPERDLMILLFIFFLGLRCSEVIGLNIGDVKNRDRLFVRGEIAKRAKPRILPLSKKLQSAIKNFLKLKLAWGESLQDESPLFKSKKNNRLSKRSLQDLFEFWCKRAGLTRSDKGKEKALYSVHSARHTFAKRLLQRGYSLQHVQKLLGHSSLASTGVYCEVDYEEIEEAMNAL